ncbi:hypothetical protein M7I_4046 [Glarea lozoyensis 74030]|uniref:Uncharacterized protein n=1 Tax=Glarea lozoyensis (strain ATCC 74030 / MF5533) TaxID=1104152 RepID=H0EN43_GLAL7|nr:hypothetical protein M7I_4046 [Glarea lozoyensis 74030]
MDVLGEMAAGGGVELADEEESVWIRLACTTLWVLEA